MVTGKRLGVTIKTRIFIARKEVSADGKCVKIFYYNGDVKESDRDAGVVRYLYHHTQTWHTVYQDGKEVLQFKNGQEEVNTTAKYCLLAMGHFRSDTLMALWPLHFQMVQQRQFPLRVKR